MAAAEPWIERGWIDTSIADELGELHLKWVVAPGPARPSPQPVRDRLADLSDLVSAPRAVSLRQRPVAEAYRVFERQIGLDPEGDPGPLETALVERIRRGEFRSAGLPLDACLIALIETGVPVWSLDYDVLVGALGVCTTQPGELLGRGPGARVVEADRLAVADLGGPLALVSRAPGPTVEPGPRTAAIALYALAVAGVSTLAVDEALWFAAGALTPMGG